MCYRCWLVTRSVTTFSSKFGNVCRIRQARKGLEINFTVVLLVLLQHLHDCYVCISGVRVGLFRLCVCDVWVLFVQVGLCGSCSCNVCQSVVLVGVWFRGACQAVRNCVSVTCVQLGVSYRCVVVCVAMCRCGLVWVRVCRGVRSGCVNVYVCVDCLLVCAQWLCACVSVWLLYVGVGGVSVAQWCMSVKNVNGLSVLPRLLRLESLVCLCGWFN